MSIILFDKKSSSSKEIPISSEFLNTTILKKIICSELSCQFSELRLFHFETDQEYNENEIVKKGDKIFYLITSQGDNTNFTDNKKKGIIYPQELEKMIENSKVIVVKSSNEENIQKSKDHSLWATTYSNQKERLRYFFQNSQNVILLFATNRSYEIKGIARMESEPDRQTDKSIWSGVSNIRLGGNFKIKWLRKKPLSLVLVEKTLGTNFKETIIKACDGQELDPSSCKKLASLFETPEEPLYSSEIENSVRKEEEKIKSASLLPIQQNLLPFPFNPNQFRMNLPLPQKNETEKSEKMKYSSSSSEESSRKKKKIKKKSHKKEKKSKKHKKSHKRNSSYSDEESESSINSDQSENSREFRKKRKSKKDKKMKKEKKSHKHHS